MKLHTFIVKMKMSYRQAGKFFGLDHTLIYKYVQGQRTPRLKTAIMISKKTKGMVKPEDLIGD